MRVYSENWRKLRVKVYVIHGNSYYDGEYGYIETLFGIFMKRDTAESAKDTIMKNLYNRNRNNVDDLCDIQVDIEEIETDEFVETELGRYIE